MLCGQAAFCQGGTDLVLGKAGKFLPDFLDTACGDIRGHFLLKVTDAQIISLFHIPGEGRDKAKDTFQESCLSDSIGSDQGNFLSSFHGQVQRRG